MATQDICNAILAFDGSRTAEEVDKRIDGGTDIDKIINERNP